MGVKDLQKTIEEHAPSAVRKTSTKDYLGKKIAIDASILLYQFITTIIGPDGEPLKNQSGEVTSHLVGLLARCARMVEAGIKPIFVFDGKAFNMKGDELQRRQELKEQNMEKANEAKQAGNLEQYAKYAKRAVKVGPAQYKQAITLLEFLGIQCIVADGEAEALCVALCRAGLVYAVASADLDCVAYGAPVFIRNLATDKDCIEITFSQVLKEMNFTQEQFIDLCILSGTDYVTTIPKVGAKTAFSLINEHISIENIIKQNSKYELPENYLEKVVGARQIFMQQNQLSQEDEQKYKQIIEQKMTIDREKALLFLVDDMQFDQKNAESRVDKIIKLKAAPKQMTLTAFLKKSK